MIFAIVCEELGVFGAAMLTLMFIFLLYRLMFIAQNAPDLLGSLIATGIFSHIALQVVLNIAVVINLIPTTGLPFPLLVTVEPPFCFSWPRWLWPSVCQADTVP